MLPQQQHTADGGEHSLQAEDDGGVGRMGAALAHHLQGVTHPHRHQSRIEQRLPARHGAAEGRGLDDKRRGQTEQAAHHKLHPGQANGGDAARVVIQHQQVNGPEQGADHLQQVAVAYGEILGDAEVIEAGHGDEGANPGVGPCLVAQDQPQHGHQYDVEPSDEARLGRRGVEQPHLLQGGGGEEHCAGDETPDQQQARVVLLVWPGRLTGLEPPQERQQGGGAEQEAQAVEGVRPHVIHPQPLGDEAQPPDGGRHQQHHVRTHTVSSLKSKS